MLPANQKFQKNFSPIAQQFLYGHFWSKYGVSVTTVAKFNKIIHLCYLPANQNFKKIRPTDQHFLYGYIWLQSYWKREWQHFWSMSRLSESQNYCTNLITCLNSEFQLSRINGSRVIENGCDSTFEVCHALLSYRVIVQI